MLSYPYKEHINICLNMQMFTGAIAKDIAIALKVSLREGPTVLCPQQIS
jgi:hypothetical protein